MNKTFASIIAIVLLLGSFAPCVGASFFENTSIDEAFQNQPILQYYFSAATLPIKIVNELFYNGKLEVSQTAHKKNTKKTNPKNSSNEFSFTAPKNKQSKHKNLIARGTSPASSTLLLGRPAGSFGIYHSLILPQNSPVFLIFYLSILTFPIFLMSITVLPRAGIEDSIQLYAAVS